jgi:hypothetical protein
MAEPTQEQTQEQEPNEITLDFTNVATLADGVRGCLIREKRNGSDEERLFWREDTPNWIVSGNDSINLMRYVAERTEPKFGNLEIFYENINYALNVIADNLSDMDADEIADYEVTDLYEYVEGDIYTRDVLNWLTADLDHIEICEDRAKEFGWTLEGSEMGIIGLFMMGQASQREGFVNAIFEFLKEKCEEENDGEDEDGEDEDGEG